MLPAQTLWGHSEPAWNPVKQIKDSPWSCWLEFAVLSPLVPVIMATIFDELAGQDAAPFTMCCWHCLVRVSGWLPCSTVRPSKHCCNCDESVCEHLRLTHS